MQNQVLVRIRRLKVPGIGPIGTVAESIPKLGKMVDAGSKPPYVRVVAAIIIKVIKKGAVELRVLVRTGIGGQKGFRAGSPAGTDFMIDPFNGKKGVRTAPMNAVAKVEKDISAGSIRDTGLVRFPIVNQQRPVPIGIAGVVIRV